MMTEAHWTLGVLIGGPLWALAYLAAIAAVIMGVRLRHSLYNDDAAAPLGIGGLVCLVLFTAIVLSPAGYYPLKAEYHQWRPVEGTVTEIGKRQISDGNGMSERYVLVVNDRAYGVDDTRASLVKVGDPVALSCRKDWQYAAAPGFVCRWAGGGG